VPVTPTKTPVPATPTPLPPMALSSAVFKNGGDIPPRHAQKPFRAGNFACTGSPAGIENLSPALSWLYVPPKAQSLVLIMLDRFDDSLPAGAGFVHWIVYNIPPSAKGLPEGVPQGPTLADGSIQGINNYPAPYDVGYGGPCPGPERHLYVFTLYALDTQLNIPAGGKLAAVRDAMKDHILAQAELRGYYTGQ